MKHTQRRAALLLALALAGLAVLTACSGGSGSSTPASSTPPASASTSGEEPRETVMGKVSYVGSGYISVTVYTGGEDATDFTALDTSALTATDETRSVDTGDETEYLQADAGMLSTAAREDVATGAFIVSTWDEDGTHQIILIDDGTVSAEESSSAVSAASGSASDEADGAVDTASEGQESAASASGDDGQSDSSETAAAE